MIALKKSFKSLFKNSTFFHGLLANFGWAYLYLVYKTSKWEFILPKTLSFKEINKKGAVFFVIWHNRSAFGPHLSNYFNNVCSLVSDHPDGRFATQIIKKMGCEVISGSTNRNPLGATREIIKKIKQGYKVTITPDGPRGPIYQINSSITALAKKLDKPIIPLSCMSNKYFQLKSWDRMIIPRMFGKIVVTIGEPINLSESHDENNELVKQSLMDLTSKSEKLVMQK